jgi:hypothetical protein
MEPMYLALSLGCHKMVSEQPKMSYGIGALHDMSLKRTSRIVIL